MPLIDVSTLVSLAGPMMQACKWIRDWWRCRKQVSVGGTPVTVAYGDIFQEKGIRVVGSTKYFEVEFGAPVEPKSLYGQFLEQRFQRKERDFEKLTREQLGKEKEGPKKSVGRPLGWKIGDCVHVAGRSTEEADYLITSIAEADPETCTASTNSVLLAEAMLGMWRALRTKGNGSDVTIPLLGKGLGRSKLTARQTVQLMLMTLKEEGERDRIRGEVKILIRKGEAQVPTRREIQLWLRE